MLSFPISGTHISPCICLYLLIVFLFLSLCFHSFNDSFYYNLYYLFMCQSVTLLPFLVTLVITVFNFLVFMLPVNLFIFVYVSISVFLLSASIALPSSLLSFSISVSLYKSYLYSHLCVDTFPSPSLSVLLFLYINVFLSQFREKFLQFFCGLLLCLSHLHSFSFLFLSLLVSLLSVTALSDCPRHPWL